MKNEERPHPDGNSSFFILHSSLFIQIKSFSLH